MRLDLFESLPSRRFGCRLAVEPLQPTLQQNRALHRSSGDSHRPAPDVELYSSTALQSALHLYSSTALYTLHTSSTPSLRTRNARIWRSVLRFSLHRDGQHAMASTSSPAPAVALTEQTSLSHGVNKHLSGTRRPPRRRGGLIALVVCEATARRRRVRRRWRLAVRWDGGMVRADVGVVRDARASKHSFTSTHIAGGRRAARARLGAAAAPREAPSEGCHTPFPAARELSSDLRSFSHTPDASR